jgi:glycosyltransferase involved in cell wall biosynthesis
MSTQWFDRETLDRIIPEYIRKVDVVLDIGCGIRPQSFFKPKQHIMCETFNEYVRILQNRFAGQENVIIFTGTGQEVVRHLPDSSVDSIFLIDVIEHLEKEEGFFLLKECERLARKQIIVFTPLGFMTQEYEHGDLDGWGLGGWEWQYHRSGWTPEDFDSSWDILGAHLYHSVNANGDRIDPSFGAFWAIKNISVPKPFTRKVALLSHILPPSPSGQSIVLYRLLQGVDPESYCLFSRNDYSSGALSNDGSHRLKAKYIHVSAGVTKSGHRTLRLSRLFSRFTKYRNLIVIIYRLYRLIVKEKCEAIIACSGDLYDIPIGFFASRLAKIPFYAYIFDDYVYQWTGADRKTAGILASIIFKYTEKIIVPNEYLRDEYSERYHMEPAVIHNPCAPIQLKTDDNVPWPVKSGVIRIVYTGAIYRAHFDAFLNLIKALKILSRDDIQLHLYTSQPRQDLEAMGISGKNVSYHPHLDNSEVMVVQERADILFLPLAFDSPIPEVIRTSAPGKLGEYLASGRPILVHAPADAFISWYLRAYDCGLVVDSKDPEALAKGLMRLVSDNDMRKMYSDNARLCALRDFNPEQGQKQFLSLFSS